MIALLPAHNLAEQQILRNLTHMHVRQQAGCARYAKKRRCWPRIRSLPGLVYPVPASCWTTDSASGKKAVRRPIAHYPSVTWYATGAELALRNSIVFFSKLIKLTNFPHIIRLFIFIGFLSLPYPERAVASTITEHTQKMLNELGYNAGSIDGIYGPATQSALDQFVQDTPNLLGAGPFEIIEQLFDRYHASSGNTVFDLEGAQPSSLDDVLLNFPTSPFGDLEALRAVRFQIPNIYSRHYCTPRNEPRNPAASQVGVLLGFLNENNGNRWRTVSEAGANFSQNGMTARGEYTDHIQSLAMDVLLGENRTRRFLPNEITAAEQLLATLRQYAEADAFRWFNGATPSRVSYSDTYGLKTVFTPTIAAWSVLTAAEPELVRDFQREIDNWIWRVLNRVDHYHGGDRSLSSNRNNQRYMLATNLMQLGLLYQSDYFVQRALFEATKVGTQQRPDGSLPLETDRGADALGYTGHATVSLMALAEYASLLEIDLYEHSETNFRPIFEFYADAIEEPSLIERYAGVGQRDLRPWRFGGMSQFCSRYPNTTGCISYGGLPSFRQALPYGHLEYNMGYDALMNACVGSLVRNSVVEE
jgi:hypothetical protein